MTVTKYRTCNLCEALCGLEITIENDQVLSIKGDKKDVFSKGHICPKAVALKDIHEDPDRLKSPMKKINGIWEKTTWEDAIKITAEKLHHIQQEYGHNAVAVYQGNPSVHNLGTTLYSPGFVRSLKTKNRYSATSVDQLAHHLAAEFMLGHQFLVPIPDINRTDFWLILGGNPLVSNGSLMTAPNVGNKLKAIQKRGGRVIVIDPRRTETAMKADQHYFIRPGTDIWLLLGMIKYILSHGLVEKDALPAFIDKDDLDEISSDLDQLTLSKVADLTGIAKESIIELATDFASAKSAVCYGRLGVSATYYGGLCHWAINTLNIITNNFDRPGGAMLTSPAIDMSKPRNGKVPFRRWSSRVRNLPEFGGELPSSTLAEDILEPGEGQIRALITSCGNPVLSVPNGNKLDEALTSLEFMVSIDIYLNETTRHADIILPPATGLETPHLGIAFHNLAIHNTLKYSDAAIPIDNVSRYDWQIFSDLQSAYEKEVGGASNVSPKLPLEAMVELLLASGQSGITLEVLKKNPHGIDLGPLQPEVHNRSKTKNAGVHLYPEIYKSPLKTLLNQTARKEGLLLIGRRHLRSNNSWLHNSYRMIKGREQCTLLMHPRDAQNRNIEDGDKVLIKSRVGREFISAEISDEIMPGTVSMPHGWGHNRAGIRLSVAQSRPGVSINDLIDEKETDSLSGVSVINGIPVEVCRMTSKDAT